MTGVDIVGALLRADADLVALVPEARIKGGALPEQIVLPALLLRVVSSTDRQPLRRGAKTRTTDRISVTVRAENYNQQRLVLGHARRICAGRIGNIGGGERVSILTAGTGPDVSGPGNSFEQTQDFRVSYDA